jgi:hypothetical protein
MFVYYYLHVDVPFRDVDRRLRGLLAGLGGMATAAYRDGEALRGRIGVGGSSELLVAKTVRIDVGLPRSSEVEMSVPIAWEATGTPGLFPTMEGDIVISSLGDQLTQLTFRGSYMPPLGQLGRAIDRVLMHHIAEASVKDFVDRIASSLKDEPALEVVDT